MTPILAPNPVRWLVRRDMPEVMAIEAGAETPWSWDQLVGFLRGRQNIGMVHDSGRVTGYALYTLDADRFTLVRLAVHRARRRRGVGSELLRRLIGKLEPRRREVITTTIPETDDVSLAFLLGHGFRAERLSRGAFGSEDGYVMRFAV